jgi:bacterioferritin (cytochrome b1)
MRAMTQEEIVAALNNALTAELGAVEMYTAHVRAIQEPGIAQAVEAIRDVEQGHARALTERIRALGGEPVSPGGAATVTGRAAGAATAQAGTAEMLRLELAEEQKAIVDYANAIAHIMDDEVTLDLLEENLSDEIQHSRWMKARILELEKRRA